MDFYCSRRVLEVAHSERWTGFTFYPADLPFDLHPLWDGIDYLGKKWPPYRWYPPDPTTFTGVEDWLSAFDEVGSAASQFAGVMVREHESWSSQQAIDWLASVVVAESGGVWRFDQAARVYSQMARRYGDLFDFDTVAREQARKISHELSMMTTAELRKRYAK
jgi:hypothetical protein